MVIVVKNQENTVTQTTYNWKVNRFLSQRYWLGTALWKLMGFGKDYPKIRCLRFKRTYGIL